MQEEREVEQEKEEVQEVEKHLKVLRETIDILKGGYKELEEKKEIPIEWEGSKDTIVIKKLSDGEIADLRRQTNIVTTVGKSTQIKSDIETFRHLVMLKAIVKAPFKIGIEEVRRLPHKFAEKLFEIVYDFNELSEEKKDD
jgi:predicted RNase H-like nuclease (RuvC/YqgF family)